MRYRRDTEELGMLIILAALVAAADPPAAAPPAPNADPVICKRDRSSDVGTHMRPKPVCMKRSDWDYIARNAQNELTSLKDRSSFDPGKADGHRPQ